MRKIIAGALALCLGCAFALAQQQVVLLVGFSAGGPTDVMARKLQPHLAKYLKSEIVIVNIPGVSGTLAVKRLKDAGPDEILLTPDFPLSLAPHMPALKDDPKFALDDFVPVAIVSQTNSSIIVKADSPLKTVKDYVATALADPTRGDYATAGVGSTAHLMMQELFLLSKEKGQTIEARHVPHKGVGPSVQSVIGGHVPTIVVPLSEALQRKGSLRALCVFAFERSPLALDVPTCTEGGYPVAQDATFGFFASKRMPEEQVRRMQKAVRAAVVAERTWFHSVGLETPDIDAVAYGKQVRDDHDRLGAIVEALAKQR